MKKVATRFTPSPTGPLHIGGVRTALFNWLYSKNQKGDFYLRVEDTDKERSKDEYKDQIIKSLKWIGINYDGEEYIQSKKIEDHIKVANELLKNGHAYKCYCSNEEIEEPTIKPVKEIFQTFFKSYSAVTGLIILIGIAVMGFIGPLFYPTDPFDMVWMPFSPPGADGFLLGTDYLGRDILSQIINGARVSIAIGFSAALVSCFIGVGIGSFAGFYGGWVEETLMRITEFFQVLPTLLFAMVIVALFGSSVLSITLAIGAVSWASVARITRSEFLRIKELDFVLASRSSGSNNMALIFRVILPNAAAPIIVQSALLVGAAITFEAGLAFLGLSDPNVISWGQVIGSNRVYILDATYTVTFPGIAIFITVLAISLVGDGLNDALNPKLRSR